MATNEAPRLAMLTAAPTRSECPEASSLTAAARSRIASATARGDMARPFTWPQRSMLGNSGDPLPIPAAAVHARTRRTVEARR